MGKGRGRGRGRGRGHDSSCNKVKENRHEDSLSATAEDVDPQQFQKCSETKVKDQVTQSKKQAMPQQSAQSEKVESVVPAKTTKAQNIDKLTEGVKKIVLGSTIPESSRLRLHKEIGLPKRPGLGSVGYKIKLKSNFIEIKFPDEIIHQYDVSISDGKNIDKTPKELNRLLIHDFVNKYTKTFAGLPVYDGKKSMFVRQALNFNGKKIFEIKYKENDSERNFQITLQWVGQVNLHSLHEAVKGNCAVPRDAIQVLDLVLGQTPSLKYVPIGSRFFTSEGSVNIGCGKEIWHGYHQSVRPSRWKLLLNIDISATVFIANIEVLEYLREIIKCDGSRALTDAQRKNFLKEIKGLLIHITYMGKAKRKYRVNGLTKLSAANQTFPCDRAGKMVQVTVQDYFKNEKGLTLRSPHLPCLHVGDVKKNVYLPMEVCKLVAGQRCKHKLSDTQTADMIKHTAKRPDKRHQAISNIAGQANFRNDEFIKTFGIQVNSRFEDVEARVLPTPGILYANDKKPMIPDKGAWNMRNKQLFQGATIKSWGIIDYSCSKYLGREDIEKFINELIQIGCNMGITIGSPNFRRIAKNSDDVASVITDALLKDPQIELLMAILPGPTPIYGRLKTICDTLHGPKEITNVKVKEILKQRGLSTQCIQSKNVKKCNPMTLAQLCLKINSKMGGKNNSIDRQNILTRPKRVFSEPVIFLGADVTHPGINDRTSPSIAAVVGSVDSIPIRYAVSVRAQKHRVEIIEDLKEITKELLRQFLRALKAKPMKIIMFRDGVSEGQFQQVLIYEMAAIQQACLELEPGYKPGITFVVVQKRHHARFQVCDRKDADRSGNCPAGTTIDTGVCHPTEFDYYQYSHAGIQGTSRPTHYHVLWDDNNFQADEMQALSFMLCHLYVRCTRSVSIPAPAYYAHHVAYRARYHLQQAEESESSGSVSSNDSGSVDLKHLKEALTPSPNMVNRMYFV